MEKPFVLPVWLQSPKVMIFCTFNANSKCCGVHSSAISNILVNWVWNVAEWLAKLCTERRHTQWVRQLMQDWIRMQTMRKSHMVSVWYGSVYERYEGCYFDSAWCWEGEPGSRTHWCGSLDWVGTQETLFASMAAETTALGTCYNPWLLGWQPQSGSRLSPVLVLGDCWLFSPIECHFSVITFGISDSILFQLQTHYVNLKKALTFKCWCSSICQCVEKAYINISWNLQTVKIKTYLEDNWRLWDITWNWSNYRKKTSVILINFQEKQTKQRTKTANHSSKQTSHSYPRWKFNRNLVLLKLWGTHSRAY